MLVWLDTHRTTLREAVDSVPAAKRDTAPGPGRWSVAEVLEHLTIIETRVGAMFTMKVDAARAAGLAREMETGSIKGFLDLTRVLNRDQRIEAPEPARPTGKLTSEMAWTALEKSRASLRNAIVTADGLALSDVSHPHPIFGELNLYQWGLLAGAHELRHAAQIREIGK